MNEIRKRVGQIRHRQGREAAVQWAFAHGYAVKWSERDGLVIRPLV